MVVTFQWVSLGTKPRKSSYSYPKIQHKMQVILTKKKNGSHRIEIIVYSLWILKN